jgi:MFS family permease
MSSTEFPADVETASANRTGVYLAILQFVFALGWTTYLIYLPQLAAKVGIAPTTVILILMLDQAIFTVTDTAMGVFADRLAPVVGRLGVVVGALTALSCAAFVALPFVAGTGPGAQGWFIGLIVIWAVTSSALRAPPLTLLGRYSAKPSIPFLSALVMVGYGLAGAVSPYLGVVLRNVDARLPFAISSAVVVITALALSRVERSVVQQSRPAAAPRTPAKPLSKASTIFIASMVILALGYQLHFSINSGPFFLRFAKPADLEWLMPVFWIGFNIAMFPASAVVKRRGALMVMGTAGLASSARRRACRQSQHADCGTVHRRCGLGLHDDVGDLGGAGARRQRRRRQGAGPGIFGAGAGDVCANGRGRRRPAKTSGICPAAALGAGSLLVRRRRGPPGAGRVPGSADRAEGEQGLVI